MLLAREIPIIQQSTHQVVLSKKRRGCYQRLEMRAAVALKGGNLGRPDRIDIMDRIKILSIK
jgi:hypothetical protein